MKWSIPDHEYMARAIRLAGQGLMTARPNPRVGCVIVNNNTVVGEGWHYQAGAEHAEVMALDRAGKKANGASCYVTLEPCVHTGRTPPCTDALIAAGIQKVVIAMQDPNPLVSGNGMLALKHNGMEISSGLLEPEARLLNPGFIRRMEEGLPYVRCKMAASLDGKVALANGESKWITGEPARNDVQRLRARSCAVLTGSGTVLADDPRLTVRDISPESTPPLRVILDRRLRCPPDASIFRHPGRVIIFTENNDTEAQDRLKQKHAEIVLIQDDDYLRRCLAHLAQAEQVNEVLVEAGPMLAGSLLSQGLIDELVLYLAPVILGNSAMSLFDIPEIRNISAGPGLDPVDVRYVGNDVRMTCFPDTK